MQYQLTNQKMILFREFEARSYPTLAKKIIKYNNYKV